MIKRNQINNIMEKEIVTSITIISKSFRTIIEICQDPEFRKFVQKNVNALHKQRHERPVAGEGRYYAKTGYDYLQNDNELSTAYFADAFPDIYIKRSSLSSAKRAIIAQSCFPAITETIKHYEVVVSVGDKLSVKDQRAKLQVLALDNSACTIKVRMLKVTEVWPIDRFVKSLEQGDISVVKPIIITTK